MAVILPRIPVLSVGDVENAAVSFAAYLDTGETLTGTPTITEVTSSDLTLGVGSVSTAELTILGQTVAIGEAVQFTVQGQLADRTYTLKVTAATTSSRTKVVYATFDVAPD